KVPAADGPSKQVSFTIHGTKEAGGIGDPMVADGTEDSSNAATVTLTAVGSISISDADTGEAHFNTTVIPGSGNLGSLSLAANGSYTYSHANAPVPALARSPATGCTNTPVDTFTATAGHRP